MCLRFFINVHLFVRPNPRWFFFFYKKKTKKFPEFQNLGYVAAHRGYVTAHSPNSTYSQIGSKQGQIRHSKKAQSYKYLTYPSQLHPPPMRIRLLGD